MRYHGSKGNKLSAADCSCVKSLEKVDFRSLVVSLIRLMVPDSWNWVELASFFHDFPDLNILKTQRRDVTDILQLDWQTFYNETQLQQSQSCTLLVSALWLSLTWHGPWFDALASGPVWNTLQTVEDHEQTSIGHFSWIIKLQKMIFRFAAFSWKGMKQYNFLGTRWTRWTSREIRCPSSDSGPANAEAFWAPPSGVAAQPQVARHIGKRIAKHVEQKTCEIWRKMMENFYEFPQNDFFPRHPAITVICESQHVSRSRALGDLRWQNLVNARIARIAGLVDDTWCYLVIAGSTWFLNVALDLWLWRFSIVDRQHAVFSHQVPEDHGFSPRLRIRRSLYWILEEPDARWDLRWSRKFEYL